MPEIDQESVKACKEDLSSLLLDENKNVSVSLLSSTYGLPFVLCSEILADWIKTNPKDAAKVEKKFSAQYSDEEGGFHVIIASEKKLEKVKKQFKKVTEFLYGLQVRSENRSIGLFEASKNVHSAIVCPSETRVVNYRIAATPAEPRKAPVDKKADSKASLFKTKPKTEPKKSPVKPVKPSPVKTEPIKTASPPKNKKPEPKKPQKGAGKAGSGNIASFFAKGAAKPPVPKPTEKPGPSRVKEEPKPELKKVPEPEVEVEEVKKRPVSSDDEVEEVPGTPQPTVASKREPAKKKFKPSGKKSRIMQLVDSSESSEEEEKPEQVIEMEVEEEVKVPSPVKEEPVEGPKRRRARRTVEKTYMDSEGFVVTRQETEEYTASEEDEPPPAKKPTPEQKTKKPPPAKTKQGNLLSFFGKK